jgi:sugar/nucleoside kinase (ribokinase family)
MNKIIGIGNALVDIIIKLQDEEVLKTFSLPKGSMQLVDNKMAQKIENETKGCETILASGGSAANTIHGLAKLGMETAFIGKIGHDTHSDFFRNDIIAAGIKPYISHGNEPTGRAITLVSPDSERTFATFLGSAIELNSQDLDDIPFSNYSVLHVEGYLVQNQKLVEGVLKIAKLNGLKTSLDLSSYNVVSENKEFLRNTIRQYVDIVFANEEEAHALTGKNPEEAAEELALICNIAVVKTGGSGSIVQKGKEQSRIGVVDAHCIDTTGAGDLYAAGFLYGLSRNLHVSRCGKIGALLAGKVIEYLGAKIPSSGWNEIKKLKDLIT